MDVSELKHEIVLDDRLWLVRWYRWLYGKRAKMDFCHLFWGTLLSLIPAVIIATALPVILPTMLSVRFLKAHPPTWIAAGATLSLRAAGTLLAWVIFGPAEKIHSHLVTAVAQERDLRAVELERLAAQHQHFLESRAQLDAVAKFGWVPTDSPASGKGLAVRRAADFWAPLWEPVQRRRSLARRAADTFSGKVRVAAFALARAAVVCATLFWLGAEVAFDVVVTLVVLMAGFAAWPVRTTWSRGVVPAGHVARRTAQRALVGSLEAVAEFMPKVIMVVAAALYAVSVPFAAAGRASLPVLRPVGKALVLAGMGLSALLVAVGAIGYVVALILILAALPAVFLVSAGATLPVLVPALVLWFSWRITPLTVRRLMRRGVLAILWGLGRGLAYLCLTILAPLFFASERAARFTSRPRVRVIARPVVAALVLGGVGYGMVAEGLTVAMTLEAFGIAIAWLLVGGGLFLARRPLLNALEVAGVALFSLIGSFLAWIVLDLLFDTGKSAGRAATRGGVSSWQVLRWAYHAVKTNTCPRIVVRDAEEI